MALKVRVGVRGGMQCTCRRTDPARQVKKAIRRRYCLASHVRTEQELGVARCVSDRNPASPLRIATAPLCYGITLAKHNQPRTAATDVKIMGIRFPRGGDTGFLYEAFPVTHGRTLTGSFSAGETRFFYVEGDQEIVCEPGMTVAEFAARNNGTSRADTEDGHQPTAATRDGLSLATRYRS